MFIPSKNSFSVSEMVLLADAGIPLGREPLVTGLTAGSLVETPDGWIAVEALLPGMRVGTWDGGFATLGQVFRHQVHLGLGRGLIHVPGGALGNCDVLTLLPAQEILLDSQVAEAVLGTSAVLVPASALSGFRGISRLQPTQTVDVVSLAFAQEEVIFVNSGTLIHCGVHCGPSAMATRDDSFFPRLNSLQARALWELIDAGAGRSDDPVVALNLAA